MVVFFSGAPGKFSGDTQTMPTTTMTTEEEPNDVEIHAKHNTNHQRTQKGTIFTLCLYNLFG
jgi:hypothetical protein